MEVAAAMEGLCRGLGVKTAKIRALIQTERKRLGEEGTIIEKAGVCVHSFEVQVLFAMRVAGII